MNECVILVDNSNIFIGGRKFSARMKGVTTGDTTDEEARDPSWRLDFDELFRVLADGRKVHSALMVGSGRPDADSVWEPARDSGFEVIVHDRRHGGEKAVDTELVARGTEMIATGDTPRVLVLASGDLDFLPLVEVAHRYGWEVEVHAFSTDFNPEGELATAVDRVRTLDGVFEQIGRYEFEWPKQEQPQAAN